MKRIVLVTAVKAADDVTAPKNPGPGLFGSLRRNSLDRSRADAG